MAEEKSNPIQKIQRKKENSKNIKLRTELSHISVELVKSVMILTLEDMNEFVKNLFDEVHVIAFNKQKSIVDFNLVNFAYKGRSAVGFHVMFSFSSIEERNIFLKNKEDDILERRNSSENTPLTNLPTKYENIKGIESKILIVLPFVFHNNKSIRLFWTHGNVIHKIYTSLFADEEKNLELALKMVDRIEILLDRPVTI
jgi:hypothetical protein